MTTTELIELLIKNEKGGITHKSREISLTINGKYMPNPQITLSSTGDGICGAEIDLDIDGDFMEEQKPMVEIDLYSVIKQKYIEREVLDKIRAEIEEQVLESLSDGGDDWFTAEKVNECLDIIDKYKAESEVSE